jgi:hypothetical protein
MAGEMELIVFRLRSSIGVLAKMVAMCGLARYV